MAHDWTCSMLGPCHIESIRWISSRTVLINDLVARFKFNEVFSWVFDVVTDISSAEGSSKERGANSGSKSEKVGNYYPMIEPCLIFLQEIMRQIQAIMRQI